MNINRNLDERRSETTRTKRAREKPASVGEFSHAASSGKHPVPTIKTKDTHAEWERALGV